MKRTIFCVALTLCAAMLAGCAVQASDRVQSPISAQTELPQMRKADDAEEIVTALLPQMEEKTEDSADAPLPVEQMGTPTDAEAEKQPAPTETMQPTAPEESVMPAPAPAPKPAASGNIYSIAEAVRAGNEYARAQYGVTIDTGMTAADSSYFPGTADSVAWLAENGGQAALTAAVKGNVDATFACLAAMDGAETVSAYARFNCTVRYDAASDEYIVVVLYG